MKIIVADTYEELSFQAASLVAKEIKQCKNLVLGLATGSTPEGMYAELVSNYRAGDIDFSSVVTFNLDEYVSLEPGHPQSYHYFMRRHLFDHVNIAPENINIPSGCAADLEDECRAYDANIEKAGGIGMQVLGIGANGHIGFNEPGPSLRVATHCVDLAEDTISANSRFFTSPHEVPRRAVTMGVGSIMKAAKIIMLASGSGKAEAIRQTAGGLVTTSVPASILQMHRDVTLIVDRKAAAQLKTGSSN
jgi:glucosamine-6-phosphate deaminase